MDVQRANDLAHAIAAELGKVVVGQEEVLEQIATVLLAGGHALLEGVRFPTA